jgi:type IV pilus assembly protein PilN
MAHINLLPWREELRIARQKQFITALISSVVISAGLWFSAESYVNSMIEGQKARNQYLQSEIVKVDKKLKEIEQLEKTRQRLEERMKVIADLQQSRPQIVHLFDEIVRTLPEGVYLNDILQTGSGIQFKGVAQSNARISAYMRNIEASEWIGKPKLIIIEVKEKDNSNESHFTLSAKQVSPKSANNEEES